LKESNTEAHMASLKVNIGQDAAQIPYCGIRSKYSAYRSQVNSTVWYWFTF